MVPLLGEWRTAGSGVPGYRALADRLRLLVLEGRLPVGTVLPSERTLATALDTSRTTTTSAYRQLREEGFAVGSQGAGTWTTLPASDPDVVTPTWPINSDGEPGPGGGRGDFSSAATEAPPQLYVAYQAALAEMPRYLPGNGYVTSGLPVLRERIAARYTERGLPTTADQILITNGALQALHLVLDVVAQRGDRVLVEHPTYPAAAEAIKARGGRPVPFPVETGWDVDRARTLLRQTGAQLAYLMLDFHNPTGALLDAAGRRRLGAVLAETGCTAIVDETMVDLDLREALHGRPFETPRPMASYVSSEQVICLGSASKTLWGGLRIGWIRASKPLIRRLAMARSNADLGSPVLEQLACAHLIDNLEPVVTARRLELARRCLALRDALASALPEWDVPLPDGGMSLWAHLPEPRSTQVAASARALGVRLAPGPHFGLDGAFESRLRLPFARPVEDLLPMVGLLARAWGSTGGLDLVDDDELTTV
ncbi:PLP-dependent aminotransferase family protein [Spongisporangium articulatum]|uniref:PLP-dependent aminotransferase family protein n=1 Tax=Spongisporangium articulatum TaxID=3362603 RepID=A0ABW8ASQ1_9ACTN